MGGLPKHQNPGEPFEITRQDGITLLLHEQVTADGSTVTIGHDITQHKRFEEQIRHSQKMEAMGQLTGGIAHDFNNLLAAIIGNLDLIENGSVNDEPNKEIFATISRAALRGSELTHRLLAFSRQQPLQAKRTQANELVPAFCRLAQRTIGEDISIEMSLAPNLWPTIVDIGQLENALLNLAINARDAMPDGGRLMIGTTNRVLDEDAVAMHMDVARGAYVEIAISDNGTGIPEDLIERVFEPFFTTKEVGQGSGLGLSMVFGFTRQSGGHVTIESKEGKGTTVRILLPRAEVAINVESDAEVSPAERPPGNETILVVEDDPDVLNFLVKGLHRLGYTVLQASDGPSALRVMAEPDAIDLLLTDVILPLGMSGRDVASAFRERNPGSGILYSSGYAKDVLSNRGQLDEEAKLIMKPYQFPTLAQQVREILDG
ncbi:MAG: response regulator [Rhodospirillaceae bacterium]|nr:response regulator [Rhodospirillaceae bacterium]MBT4689003.1 response regulator [Rhodospirillaceae bacterium]MBT6427841.1 response regulator [Rhodospirillaceae bacterium]MBT7759960.1 response regulator [Rhodospirillaceae bacterium]